MAAGEDLIEASIGADEADLTAADEDLSEAVGEDLIGAAASEEAEDLIKAEALSEEDGVAEDSTAAESEVVLRGAADAAGLNAAE